MGEAHKYPAPQAGSFPEIPGYRIEAVIGRGSAGTVYRALQLAVERKVALKVLHPELAMRGRSVRRLQREARTTARLSHPGIVSAIDMGTSGGVWWYAMELVEGPSLAEKLRKEGRLAERDILRIFIPLCEALEHAFDQGVVHRDIKPGNILIEASGRARLVDLGLAFAEDDPALTAQGGTLGTPHYISPEQARDPSAADVRSDIWSLGATLYHCACGRPPFAGESVAEILSGVLYQPVPDPTEFEPELSKGLCLVLRKCLTRTAERRYQHPKDLREDLERIRERRAVSVRERSLDPLAGERERRARLVRVAAVSALALGLVALALWQPWRADEGSGATAPLEARFEELEALATSARNDATQVAPALARLADLAQRIPPEFDGRLQQVRREIRARLYDELLPQARSQFEAELSRLWHRERDFVRALAWIDAGAPAKLRAELELDPEQARDVATRFDFAHKRDEVERDMNAALEDLDQKVRDFYADARVAQRGETARAAGRWRTARAALQLGGTELIAQSKLGIAGFPPERVEILAASLEANVVRRAVEQLEHSWSVADRARADEVATLRETLLQGLSDRTLEAAAERLDAGWNEIAARDRLIVGEELDEVSGSARLAYLSARSDLEHVERENRRADALSVLDDNVREVADKWALRRFDELAARFAELEARPTLEPVRAQVRRLRTEAEVLDLVMQRAARAIEELGSTRAPLEITLGGIPRSGSVEESNRVLERGFRFRSNDARPDAPGQMMCLRELPGSRATLLGRVELERLAGLATATPTADQRLQLALLRWHLGDIKEAAQVRLDTPENAQWAELVPDLARRIAARGEEALRADQDIAERARELLIKVRVAARDPAALDRTQLARIRELLTKYGDVEEVRREADLLRQRRDTIEKALALSDADILKRTFGPSEFEMLGNGSVRMRFAFGAAYNGAFARGDWRDEVDGWQAPRAHERADLRKEVWPTLQLLAPLDVQQALTFELEFRQPRESGPPRLLALTVAGVHVVFVGPREPGLKSRYKIAAGDAGVFDQLIADVLEGRKGTEFDGFKEDATYKLKVELRQDRGEVVVSIDGKALDRESPKRPELNATGDKTIQIRSLEPVRILAATLRAAYDVR